MLNLDLGTHIEIDGRTCIRTRADAFGHAVFGPYIDLPTGHFAVEYNLTAVDGQTLDRSDICAVLDVAGEHGRIVFAREEISTSRLAGGPLCVALQFEVTRPGNFEFRVAVTGTLALIIDDYCRVVTLPNAGADSRRMLDETRFPGPKIMPKPAFFLDNLPILYRFIKMGRSSRSPTIE